jgi:DNA-binding MarR family transcriptional regulator
MTTKQPRITHQGLKVLGYFAANPTQVISGSDIARASGLLSGTLYPLLIRFEGAGWLSSAWEDANPVEVGRPKKRLYKLTGAGQQVYKSAMQEITPGALAWA